ncbi:hypothetical protein SDJN02_17222, partial [Cucurbita argyrosperma subsp. argyrosperma]
MAATRLLRSVRPSSTVVSSSSSSSPSTAATVRCLGKAGLNSKNGERLVTSGDGERRQIVNLKAAAAPETVETETRELDLGSLLANLLVQLKNTAVKTKIRRRQIQKFIEKIIIDCRFFTLFAVAGSLLGSILCFLEGSFIVAESYLQYFNGVSRRSDESHAVELLIESLDMFLVGTALVVFGVGLFAMFNIPTWVEMESVSEAKSKIGHAVMMILQVGVLEKFKSIPLSSATDLACFAAAILISSASIFFLSRLNIGGGGGGGYK